MNEKKKKTRTKNTNQNIVEWGLIVRSEGHIPYHTIPGPNSIQYSETYIYINSYASRTQSSRAINKSFWALKKIYNINKKIYIIFNMN